MGSENDRNFCRYRQGLTFKTDKAYETKVCFSATDGKTHLIDSNGNQIHVWDFPGLPGDILNPELAGGEKGHLIVQYTMLTDAREKKNEIPDIGIFGNRTVAEIDWDGNPVWEWGQEAPGGAVRQNHDWQRLSNGNTLLMVTLPRVVKDLGNRIVGDQGIYEISPSGEIVWQWFAGDHLSEFEIPEEGLAYLKGLIAENPVDIWGYLELNTMQILGPNKWYRAGYEDFHPDNIIISSRKASFIAIIQKKTGKVVWKLGPYSFLNNRIHPDQKLYNRKIPRPLDGTSGQHKPHLIPEGLPGEGNLLLLDNNGGSGYPPVALHTHAGSRVLEVNPVSREIVWDYTAEDSGDPVWTFFTSFVGNVQRLPNGNTLINEGMHGRIFQVTREGELVWEYINPYTGRFLSAKGTPVRDPMVYRAQAVSGEWIP